MSVLEAIETVPAHVTAIVQNMRRADREELEAAGSEPMKAVSEGVEHSIYLRTLMVDGEPAMIYGIVRLADDMWSPWALGTDAIKYQRKEFLRFSKKELQRVTKAYPLLCNQVDHRNQVAINWLKWLGFEVFDPVPVGANAHLFHPFLLRAS